MTSARSALVFLVLAAASCASLLLGACRETATSSVTLRESGVPDATLSPSAWGNTQCGACALEACSAERATCAADPLCARDLDCLEACDVDRDQEPAAACAAQCSAAAGSTESQAAGAALELCRTRGAGALCASCYGGTRTHYDPALTNVCPSPHWDAGPDATPDDEMFSKCKGERCCAVRDACNNDPDCSALVDCLAATNNDGSLQAACYAQHDSALALYGPDFACVAVLCGSLLAPANDCFRCSNEYCGDPLAACLSTRDCFLVFECTNNCPSGDTQCTANCLAQYPAGVDGITGFSACASKACPVCASGADGGM